MNNVDQCAKCMHCSFSKFSWKIGCFRFFLKICLSNYNFSVIFSISMHFFHSVYQNISNTFKIVFYIVKYHFSLILRKNGFRVGTSDTVISLIYPETYIDIHTYEREDIYANIWWKEKKIIERLFFQGTVLKYLKQILYSGVQPLSRPTSNQLY